MSALGQKQTYAAQKVMSALPPKADMCSATRDTRAPFISATFIAAGYTHYDREASMYRFVGPKRIEWIAGVYEAGVAAVA